MYLGNQPALSYTSFAKQDFTTSATTSYTLDNPVANANELALFINFVRQEPTTAYSASGTTLTLTSATSSSDDMYCVYLGKAVQTVNPPNASVGASQIVDASITSGKLASGVLPTNTPSFSMTKNATQGTSANSWQLITWQVSNFDTDSGVDLSNNKYVIPTGKAGKYFLTLQVSFDYAHRFILGIYKNGTSFREFDSYGSSGETTFCWNVALDLAAGDELKAYYYSVTATGNIRFENSTGSQLTRFEGFKLIG